MFNTENLKKEKKNKEKNIEHCNEKEASCLGESKRFLKKVRKVFYEKGNHLGNEGKRIILRKKNENENV